MSAAQRKMVNTYLPCTRILSDRRTSWAGQEVDLVRFGVANRERLVPIKAGLG